ncbi:MAG: hypothetical protein QXD77_02175 [Candidatus Aenigmatarchaeota archaeon]
MPQEVIQGQTELAVYDPKKRRPSNVYTVQLTAADAPIRDRPGYGNRLFERRKRRRSILAP